MIEPAQSPIRAWNSRADIVSASHSAIWLRWLAYTEAGYVLRGLILTAAPVRTPGDLALAQMVGALGLGIVAFLQWRILARYLDRSKWWSWVGATVFGQLAATVVVTLLVAAPILLGGVTPLIEHLDPSALQFLARVITGALLGAALGFAQWLVLRRDLLATGWWIPATSLAGAALGFVTPASGLSSSAGLPPLVTAQLISGVIVGSITGIALIWLLRKSQESTSHLSAADPTR
jgi:hypothetical protein